MQLTLFIRPLRSLPCLPLSGIVETFLRFLLFPVSDSYVAYLLHPLHSNPICSASHRSCTTLLKNDRPCTVEDVLESDVFQGPRQTDYGLDLIFLSALSGWAWNRSVRCFSDVIRQTSRPRRQICQDSWFAFTVFTIFLCASKRDGFYRNSITVRFVDGINRCRGSLFRRRGNKFTVTSLEDGIRAFCFAIGFDS